MCFRWSGRGVLLESMSACRSGHSTCRFAGSALFCCSSRSSPAVAATTTRRRRSRRRAPRHPGRAALAEPVRRRARPGDGRRRAVRAVADGRRHRQGAPRPRRRQAARRRSAVAQRAGGARHQSRRAGARRGEPGHRRHRGDRGRRHAAAGAQQLRHPQRRPALRAQRQRRLRRDADHGVVPHRARPTRHADRRRLEERDHPVRLLLLRALVHLGVHQLGRQPDVRGGRRAVDDPRLRASPRRAAARGAVLRRSRSVDRRPGLRRRRGRCVHRHLVRRPRLRLDADDDGPGVAVRDRRDRREVRPRGDVRRGAGGGVARTGRRLHAGRSQRHDTARRRRRRGRRALLRRRRARYRADGAAVLRQPRRSLRSAGLLDRHDRRDRRLRVRVDGVERDPRPRHGYLQPVGRLRQRRHAREHAW